MPQQPTPTTALPSTIGAPRIIKYVSPTTGKSYSFNWNKPTDPTIDDYNNLKKSVDDYEAPSANEQNIAAAKVPDTPTPSKRPDPTVASRLEEMAGGIYGMGKQILLGGPDPMTNAMMGGFKQGAEMAANPAYEGVSGKAKGLAEIAGIPVSNLEEDWRTRSYGAGAVDLAQTGLSLFGGYEGIKGAIKPKPVVVPDVTPVTPPVKPPLPTVEPPAPQAPRALLGPRREPTRFLASPSGKVGDVLDPSHAEAIQALELDKPGTTTRPQDLGLDRGVELGGKPVHPWDLESLGTTAGPESYSPPRSQGIQERPQVVANTLKVKSKVTNPKTGKVTTKTTKIPVAAGETSASAIRGKVISGEIVSADWLNEDPFWATIPDRFRPEAPNVTMLRNLSEGTPKAGAPAPTEGVNFLSGPRENWGGTPKTVTIGEGLRRGIRNPRLDYGPEPDLPSAPVREHITKRLGSEEFVTQQGRVLPKVEFPPTSDLPPVEPIAPPKSKIPPAPEPATIVGAEDVGKFGYKKFVNQNPAFKAIMDKLIKYRSAGDLVGKGIRDKFAGIKNITADSLPEFQQSMLEGRYPEVSKFFADWHEKLNSLGISVEEKKNYLPQLWKEKIADVRNALGDKQLNAKAPFQMESIFKDYQTGIEKGLTPKMSPIELMEWYGKRANKLIADEMALRDMKSQGYIVREGKMTSNMESMAELGPSFKSYYADSTIKSVVKNYLKSAEAQTGLFASIAKGTGKLTNLALSSGLIPNKPLFTAHGFNMLGRAFMEGEGPIGRVGKAVKYGLNPEAAAAVLEKENAAMVDATQKYGFKSHVESPTQKGAFFDNTDTALGSVKGGVNRLTELQHKYFEGPLFEKMIPALKWDAWKTNFEKFKASGMAEDAAGHAATKVSDSFYSGKNLDLLYNNKHFNTAARILTLAPDWLRSTVDLGVNIPKETLNLLKDPKSPVAKTYAMAGAKIMATYAAANMLQKALTGKFMVENDPEDMFTLKLGNDLTGEKTRGLKLFGSAADFVKAPLELAKAAVTDSKTARSVGKTAAGLVKGKASPIIQASLDAITGEDYKGDVNIFGDKSMYNQPVPLKERMGNTISQAINFGPPQIASNYDMLTGRLSPEEAVARIGELPLAYRRKPAVKIPPFNVPMPGLGFPQPKVPSTKNEGFIEKLRKSLGR